jgi:hypothetical protein
LSKRTFAHSFHIKINDRERLSMMSGYNSF